MLGSHPEMYGFPELRLFIGPTIGALIKLQAHVPDEWADYARSGLIRSVAEVMFGSQSDDNISAAFAWLDERSTVAPTLVFDILRAEVAPRIALEKSPDTVNNDNILRRCIDAYPNAKFVHLVRHPVATMTSMISHWSFRAGRLTTDQLAVAAAHSWFHSHRRVCALGETLPEDRFFRIMAEDALANPLNTSERFARWLGLSTNPKALELMQHPELSPYAKIGPARALGGNDPKFLTNPQIRVGRQEQPEHFPDEWSIGLNEREALVRLAEYFGYNVRTASRGKVVMQ